MGATRVFQFSSDPSKRLLGHRFHIALLTVLKQLGQRCCKQFGSPTIRIGLELVPLPVANTERMMQRLGLLYRTLRPEIHSHANTYEKPFLI